MGRRKIEIKAIKDDRNRSVTFLKRKGGLFKKAHELSVLCSVDVAVIIFGQNKKLYEFSSGNIHETLNRYHYYQGPHEHKGPSDFADKNNDDDDDDDDREGSGAPEEPSPPHHGVYSQPFQNQPALQHIRRSTASPSPPMANGVFHNRSSSTPQPFSRPTSRTDHRRQSSNLVPNNHPQPHAAQPGMYYPHPVNGSGSFYTQHPNPAVSASMQMPAQHHTPPMHSQTPPMHSQTPPMHHTPPLRQQQHQYSHPLPQAQQAYAQDERRSSLPGNFLPAQPDRPDSQPRLRESPPQLAKPFQSPPMPGEPSLTNQQSQGLKPPGPRSHSIYTPIDDSNSILAQQWGRRSGERRLEGEHPDSVPRSQPVPGGTPPLQTSNPGEALLHRTNSVSSQHTFAPPSRVNSLQSQPDAKRPRLTVQIPSEHSEAGSVDASPRESGRIGTAGSGNNSGSGHGSAIVLPPPSPTVTSAGAVLSEGATGPQNPFARPPVPAAQIPSSNPFKDVDTPISALPSRVMGDALLPSPSQFYPEWNFNSNKDFSPAVYQPTPISTNIPAWKDDDLEKKRKSSGDGPEDGSSMKKAKVEA